MSSWGIFHLTICEKTCKIGHPFMADVAQLVRALVCGTRCREFESHLPPHFLLVGEGGFIFLRKKLQRCEKVVK